MRKEHCLGIAAAGALLLVAACGGITNPVRLEEFQWGEVEDPTTVEEGMDASVALGDVFVAGELNTPKPCYTLTADFENSGSQLTLRVHAKESGTQNCGDGIGGFRYTAVIRYLKFGNYDLRVIHEISGGQTNEFTASLDVH